MKHWLEAFRLRTLPLALASVFMGSVIAAYHGIFNEYVAVLTALTTVFLQILSNLANDYGDAASGADNEDRVGPRRAVQSGLIPAEKMKKAIIFFSFLALISGIALIVVGTRGLYLSYGVFFFLLGVVAIAAAIKYTVGKNPYGYRGLGDLFVFLFFGPVGVCGTYFLHTASLSVDVFLPAIAIGLFSSAVLNVNNLRDYENDKKSGKNTLVVKMGKKNAVIYHFMIIILAWLSLITFALLSDFKTIQYLFLLLLPISFIHLKAVLRDENESLDAQLKVQALTTFFVVILMGVALLIL
ncbi:MAG: 1,4-dihydroxy-2-naphthoate polyprenyltransferase [Chitinophagaceae bacterium]|nr:MAG: 1,4-dihydroxy-2-naphthoate polyprenyltransferase [Chitinophagaceae bacterium]